MMSTRGREVKLVDTHYPICESSLKVGRVVMTDVNVFEKRIKKVMVDVNADACDRCK